MSLKILFPAVIGLVLTLLVCVTLIGLLALNDKAIPDILQNISSANLAGLIGLLVQAKEPTPPQGP